MTIDPRNIAAKAALEIGSLSDIKQLFTVIPRTVIAGAIGINYRTLNKKIEDPGSFTLKEITRISRELRVEPSLIAALIFPHIPK
jgi:hypothetical protein